MKRFRGFSLVELLSTLAVIGILAAMIFPVYSRAVGQSYETRCANNLRQLGLATLIYVQDHDDKLPGFTAAVPGISAAIPWTAHLAAYSPAYFCPVRNNTYGCNRVHGGVPGEGLCVDYRYSAGRSTAAVDAQNTVWVADTFPTRTVISSVAELPAWVSPGGRRYGYPLLASNPSTPEAGVMGWHFERANVVFADGHVKSMGLAELGRRHGGKSVYWTKETD